MDSSLLRRTAVVLVFTAACSARGNFSTGTGTTDAGSATDGTTVTPTDTGTVNPGRDVPVTTTDRPTVTDTGPNLGCGDGTCSDAESCSTCPRDCGPCPASCGDGTCGSGENCTNCAQDCGACAPRCGDGICNGSETCTSCPSDCGACADPCVDLSDCASCVANSRCGWCAGDDACLSGTSSGPSSGGSCSSGWARTCTTPPVDAGTTDITGACPSGSGDGLGADCLWRSGGTFSCTPGSTVTVGCTGGAPTDGGACVASLGTCAGDPMIRACAGSGACSAGGALAALATTGYSPDDACGTCPVAQYTCPSSGSMTVYQRSYYVSPTAPVTCILAHR